MASHNKKIKHTELKLQDDEREQYTRRQCLRINGVPTSPNETADDCLKQVINVFKDSGVAVPEVVLDRAHRIGRPNGKSRPIIVKFSTWRHRTCVYRARKHIREKFGFSVQPDLTKSRLDLLTKVKELCKESNEAEYAFADVKCSLCLKMRGHGIKFFRNMEEAEKILGLVDTTTE